MSGLAFEEVPTTIERTAEPSALQARRPDAVTPMSLIERAVSAGASIEQMQQLLELQIRWEQNEAKKAFDQAMARFKANAPTITKNVSKKAGNIDLYYASLDNCVRVIVPSLAAYGIRHHWENDQSVQGQVAVTCILSHELGHSESTKLTAGYDTSGGKNAIQAIASAVTYLQRYTLLGATGLAASGTDNDGVAASSGQSMPEEDFLARRDAIEGAVTEDELKKFYMASVQAAEKIGDKQAVKDFAEAKNKRWREIKGGAR